LRNCKQSWSVTATAGLGVRCPHLRVFVARSEILRFCVVQKELTMYVYRISVHTWPLMYRFGTVEPAYVWQRTPSCHYPR
jgi:hypothetical protein